MKDTPFITAMKEIRLIVPGDIAVDREQGARFVTSVATNMSGDFVVGFHLPDVEATAQNTLCVDRFWGTAQVPVVLGMTSTNQKSEIDLLLAQLAARDAALNAVLQLAMSQAGPSNPVGFEIVALLEKNGVRI